MLMLMLMIMLMLALYALIQFLSATIRVLQNLNTRIGGHFKTFLL